jgi:hypothetical protein
VKTISSSSASLSRSNSSGRSAFFTLHTSNLSSDDKKAEQEGVVLSSFIAFCHRQPAGGRELKPEKCSKEGIVYRRRDKVKNEWPPGVVGVSLRNSKLAVRSA